MIGGRSGRIFMGAEKANKFFCLKENDPGYKELVVYNMKWELSTISIDITCILY